MENLHESLPHDPIKQNAIIAQTINDLGSVIDKLDYSNPEQVKSLIKIIFEVNKYAIQSLTILTDNAIKNPPIKLEKLVETLKNMEQRIYDLENKEK